MAGELLMLIESPSTIDGTVCEETLIPERGLCDHSGRAQDMHNRERIEGTIGRFTLLRQALPYSERSPDPTLHHYFRAEDMSYQRQFSVYA